MFSSWSSKKDLQAAARDEYALIQQLIDMLRADGGDQAGAQLVAGEYAQKKGSLGCQQHPLSPLPASAYARGRARGRAHRVRTHASVRRPAAQSGHKQDKKKSATPPPTPRAVLRRARLSLHRSSAAAPTANRQRRIDR